MRVLVTSPHARVVRTSSGKILNGGDPNSGNIAQALAKLLLMKDIDVVLLDGRDFPECARTQEEADELMHQNSSRKVYPIDYNRWQRRNTHFGNAFESATADYHIDVHTCPKSEFKSGVTVMATNSSANISFEKKIAHALNARVVNAREFMLRHCKDNDDSGLLVNAKADTPAVALEFAIEADHSSDIKKLSDVMQELNS